MVGTRKTRVHLRLRRRTTACARIPPEPARSSGRWHVVDAEDVVLGRLSTEVARILRGKHRPIFAPHLDTGDHVIVVNAAKVVLSSNKADRSFAYRHSGYPGQPPRHELRRAAPQQAGGARPQRRPGDAAEGPPRPEDAHQAEGLRRPRAPPRRPAAAAARAAGVGPEGVVIASSCPARPQPAGAGPRPQVAGTAPRPELEKEVNH